MLTRLNSSLLRRIVLLRKTTVALYTCGEQDSTVLRDVFTPVFFFVIRIPTLRRLHTVTCVLLLLGGITCYWRRLVKETFLTHTGVRKGEGYPNCLLLFVEDSENTEIS